MIETCVWAELLTVGYFRVGTHQKYTASCYETYRGNQRLETWLTEKSRTELRFVGIEVPHFEVVFSSNTVRQPVRGQSPVHDSRRQPRNVNHWRFLLCQGQPQISRGTRNCQKQINIEFYNDGEPQMDKQMPDQCRAPDLTVCQRMGAEISEIRTWSTL